MIIDTQLSVIKPNPRTSIKHQQIIHIYSKSIHHKNIKYLLSQQFIKTIW